jgi:hypothetical protein
VDPIIDVQEPQIFAGAVGVTKKVPYDVAKKLDKFADKMDRIGDPMTALGYISGSAGLEYFFYKKLKDEKDRAARIRAQL